MNYYLGVDIAKINYAASLINSNGVIKFINSNVDLNKLLSTLQNKLGNLNNIEIAMETIGYYLLSLYSALINNSFNVFANNSRKQKNDIINSIIIAYYLRVFGSKKSKLPK